MPAVLDPAAAARLRRLGGERLLREMVELFLQLGESRLAAAAGPDAEAAERACHSLKSAAANLGAVRLQQAAEVAEGTASGPAAEHRAAVAVLAAAYREAEQALRVALEESKA